MDWDTLFTDKECHALLTSNMLNYDIGNFSFKNKLIFCKQNWKIHPAAMEYGTEHVLLNTICNKLKLHTYNTMLGAIHPATPDQVTTVGMCKSYIPDHDRSCALIHRNNYYIDLQRLLGGLCGISKAKDLKSTRFYDGIVTFMLAATHYDSLVPHLKWLCSARRNDKYEDVIELRHLQNALESKTEISDIFVSEDTMSVPYAPFNRVVADLADTPSKECVEQCFLEIVTFGIEILNRIESIDDEALRDVIYDMFNVSYPQNKILELLYKFDTTGNVEINPKVLNIIKIKEMDKRYYAIKDFVDSVRPEIELRAAEFAASNVGINSIFSEFIKFCQNESIMNIRVKTVFMLYEFIVKNGWKSELDTYSLDSDDMPMPGSISSTSSDFAEMPETYSMMDLHRGSYVSDTLSDDLSSKHKDTAGIPFEELDRLSAKFNHDKYEYEVDTVLDTTDHWKADYDNVAEHMSLLNKNLIRSIKEIKVYNTGGKNAGKKTGKLDRKNLYKYKTSKDIFYDNTYKIRESDLAFGIILDVSGSMHGEGIRNGRTTMIVLHETLKALNINHSIITHNSSGYHQSKIKRYQTFNEDKNFQCNKNYALASIKSGGGNCDSGALHYMEQCMRRVKNKDKICIIFSDGEPTECSDTELKDQVRYMEKNGITVIGIGIDFPSIKEYYNNNANGKNLKEMFDIVSGILKQYVLDKVDKE